MLKIISQILVGMFGMAVIFAAATEKSNSNAKLSVLINNGDDFAVYTLKNCDQNSMQSGKRFNLLAINKSPNSKQVFAGLSSWNHVLNANSAEWSSVRLSPTDYSVTETENSDLKCNPFHVLNIVLLRKYADWNHQHANGFEIHSEKSSIKFGQLKSMIIDIKLNSARTYIPELFDLKQRYSNFVDEESIKNIDHQKINLGFTLYSDQSMKATTVIELDQKLIADQWIRLELKPSDFKFYSEVNYQQTPRTQKDFNQLAISGVLVVGETGAGKVLRNSIKNWTDSIPETFKEMDFSFKKIEFVLE